MERLTFIKCPKQWRMGRHPTKYSSRQTFQQVVDRLAEYENTGLTPSEVEMAIAALREQEERERTSADAFGDIAWYNGHMEWLETIRKEMMECDGFYMCPVRPKEWNTDKHTLWMFLCGMFGKLGNVN